MSLRKIIVFHPGAARLGNRFRFTEMTTKIWIEQLRHPDGRPRYTSRGQLYRTRLGGPDGEVLCEQTVSPVCPSCRVLLARGITGPFETWKEGVPYACMRGDVEKVAGLTVKEPDRGAIAFARWNAFPSSPVEARTRGDIKPGSVESLQTRTPVCGRAGEQCRRPRNETATFPCLMAATCTQSGK